jgi:hypothetical protein
MDTGANKRSAGNGARFRSIWDVSGAPCLTTNVGCEQAFGHRGRSGFGAGSFSRGFVCLYPAEGTNANRYADGAAAVPDFRCWHVRYQYDSCIYARGGHESQPRIAALLGWSNDWKKSRSRTLVCRAGSSYARTALRDRHNGRVRYGQCIFPLGLSGRGLHESPASH